jgi:hypothetical protein
MNIVETLTGKPIEVMVTAVEIGDFKKLTVSRYFFNWHKYKTGYSVYKLLKPGSDDILGVMAIIDVPAEFRIEISLICCSRENYSNAKQYDRIAGYLIAFAAREAVKKYGADAAISLLPKTDIREHYKKKYGMEEAGRQIVLLGKNLTDLIKEYL